MGLDEGRQAFARQEWREAYARLAAADAESPLDGDDLERLARTAYLVARDAEAVEAFRRAHQVMLEAGRLDRAAHWAFWLSFDALLRGDSAQSAGWLGRLQRLVKSPDCAEQAYLHMLAGLGHMGRADGASAAAEFEAMLGVAERFPDADALAFALLGLGEAWILVGRVADGVRQLDEAMVAVSAGAVSPMAAGIIYCAVILACQQLLDLRRSREWTRALGAWCAVQPDLVRYRGECLVHRSEVLQLDGEWSDAIAEARLAIELHGERNSSIAGRAAYQCAELHRVRGDFALAEELYRDASRHGTEPQPGLSLLRLAQGQLESAGAAMRRVMAEAAGSRGPSAADRRCRVLAAAVEVMLAVRDHDAARAGAEGLGELAASNESPILRTTWRQAAGAVRLAAGDGLGALAHLREAWTAWQDLGAPYEAARTRVLIGEACRSLGDEDTARDHIEAASLVFARLGAAPALAALDARDPAPAPATPTGPPLTGRELEVLRLIAAGKSNREIGTALFISEHTVARHVSNIFDKLDVSSRTAAAAFALKHHLV